MSSLQISQSNNHSLAITTQDRGILLKLAALCSLALAVVSAFLNSYSYDWPSGDEHWHFSYSQRFIDQGILERETVHNYNSTTPLIALNVLLDRYLNKLGVTTGFDKIAVRLPALAWYVMLLVLCFAVPYRLFGLQAGLWSVLLASLDQNLLGHAPLVGTDLPFATITLFFLLALQAYRVRPQVMQAVLLGVILGIAFNVKYSATFLLLITILVLPMVRLVVWFKSQQRFFAALGSVFLHFLLIALISSIIVDAAYGFKEIGQTLASKTWYSEPFKFLVAKIPNMPLPWPLPFIAGFDHQFAAERSWAWNVILLGNQYPNGVWYYFPVVWLLKTPLAIIGLTFIGVLIGLRRSFFLLQDRGFSLTFLVWAILLCYFCFVFRTQVGIRYAAMCLPLGYILLSKVLSTSLPNGAQSFLGLVLLLGSGWEIAPYLGNNLAFTNGIISKKEQAYSWIVDSNIDWFHNYTKARALAERQLGAVSFNPRHLIEGNNLFTINQLAGVMRNYQQHAWIRDNLQPKGHFGYTLVWYQVDKPLFQKFLKEKRSLSPPVDSSAICPDRYVYQTLSSGTTTELGGEWEHHNLYTACLKVLEPTVLEVKLSKGYAAIGSYPQEFNCQGEEVGTGESLWFKLAPGVYPFCANVMSTMQGDWVIHSGRAELALRNQ